VAGRRRASPRPQAPRTNVIAQIISLDFFIHLISSNAHNMYQIIMYFQTTKLQCKMIVTGLLFWRRGGREKHNAGATEIINLESCSH
jgi:hypothetical protein